MTGITVDQCFTAVQKRQLKEDIKEYIRDVLREQAQEEAVKIGREWLKANREFVKQAVEEEMLKQVKRRCQKIYLDITY